MWTLLFLHSGLAGPRAEVRAGASLPHRVYAPAEPILAQLDLVNTSQVDVVLDAYAQPGCFVAAYLELAIQPSVPPKPVGSACTPAPKTLAPGETMSVRVDLRTLFELGPAHTIGLTWRPPETVQLSTSIVQLGPFSVRPPLQEAVVEKGADLVLPKGTFTFVGHSHKQTMSGGPPSPLMVGYRWTPTTGPAVEDTAYLYVSEGLHQFPVGPYLFEHIDQTYGRTITVRVFPGDPPTEP